MSCVDVLKEEFRLVNLRLRHHQPHRFVTAQHPKAHRLIYVIYRWVVAHYLLAVCIASGVRSNSWYWFIYLTHWTILSLTFSHWVRAGSALYCFIRHKPSLIDSEGHMDDKMPWYLKLLWTTVNVSGAPSLSVTGLYWTVVYSNTDPVDFVNFGVHGSNTIIVLIDHFITAVPMRVLHLHHPVTYGFTYSAFTGIYYGAGGTTSDGGKAIYSVLDYENNAGVAVAMLIVGTFIVVPLLHLLLFGLYKLRVFIYRKCGHGEVVPENPEKTRSDVEMGADNPAFVNT